MLDNTSCDLIAGRKGKKFCIECKATKSKNKYITKEQINDFLVFSEIFGLEPVVAIKFNRKGWFFLHPRDLEDTGKYWSLSLKLAEKKGKKFSQMFQEKKKTDEDIYDEMMASD